MFSFPLLWTDVAFPRSIQQLGIVRFCILLCIFVIIFVVMNLSLTRYYYSRLAQNFLESSRLVQISNPVFSFLIQWAEHVYTVSSKAEVCCNLCRKIRCSFLCFFDALFDYDRLANLSLARCYCNCISFCIFIILFVTNLSLTKYYCKSLTRCSLLFISLCLIQHVSG